MSPEEADALDTKVRLSGHSKQDYIVSCVLDKDITVYGSPYVFRSLQDELIRFTSLYGTQISEDDEEMLVWVLKMILAMRTKDTTNIAP